MKPTIRINDLIDEHADYVNCKDKKCPMCAEIRLLRNSLEREPTERYKHILDKGQDMKKSDIQFLLDNDVNRLDMRKAMVMDANEFQEIMVNYGFSKRREERKRYMRKNKTAELFEEYKVTRAENPLMSVRKLAAEMGVNHSTLQYHVNRWIDKGLLDTSSIYVQKETYESVKKQVGEVIKGDPDLVKKLEGRITELQKQANGYPALQKRAAKLEIENMKLEDNLKKESLEAYYSKKDLEKAAEKIETLNGTVEDLMVEVADWRDKAHSYARENDLMNGTNRNLREIAEQHREENRHLRGLVTLWAVK